jgi:molybdenum cofactor synthesis domain-containing protein
VDSGNISSMSPAPTAQVLIVGDEVLTGEVVDLNGPLLLTTLARLGTRVLSLRVLPDRPEPLAAAIRELAPSTDFVLVTGGIGPTHDDCTRVAVAQALGRSLVLHPAALARLQGIFHHRATPEESAMALLPQGSELLLAPQMGAFGFQVENVLVFPGVPKLFQPLLAAAEDRLAGRPWHRREVLTRLREGRIAAPLAELAGRWPDLRWGSYPELTENGWHLRLVLRGEDPGRLDRALAALQNILVRLETEA